MTTTKTVQPPRLLEDPPLHVESLLAAAGAEHLHRLICVRADMAEDGLHYGDQWLVVTQTRAIIARQVAGKWSIVNTSIDDVVRAHTEVLVGGGLLLIEPTKPSLSVAFTSTEAAKSSEVARGIEQLRKHQLLHINSHLERVRCQHCHCLLPEKDGICPACIRKWSTIKRITGYISPPLVTRRIIDDDGFPYSTDQRDDDSGVSCSGSGCVDS